MMDNTSKSSKLRKNKKQHTKKNVYSKNQDILIQNSVKRVKEYIEKKFDIEVTHESRLYNKEIEKNLGIEGSCKKSSYIKPDGGFLSINVNGKKCIILTSEQKRQGTNDQRILEGKKKQSNGNAVERLAKNVSIFDTLFSKEDIYPFACFMQGCDFNQNECNILDRVRGITKFILEFNKINLHWVESIENNLRTGGSYFVETHSMYEMINAKKENREPILGNFTENFMYEIMCEISCSSVEYYLKKYG